MLDIKKLALQRKAELENRQKAAIARWKPYISIVEGYYKEQGRELPQYQAANIAQCCQNIFDFYLLGKMKGTVNEETTSDAIAFARQMLPTIPALLPSLVADHVSVVQAIDRPQSQVYFMNLKSSIAKGNVAAAQQLIGAKVGHAAGEGPRKYASDVVVQEVNKKGTGAQTLVLDPVANLPIIAGSVIAYATTTVGGVQAVETFTDDYDTLGTLTLTGSRGSTGVYVLATGVITLDAGAGNTVDAVATAVTYRWNVETFPEGIGGMDIEIVSENVDARTFPLKLTYSIFGAINLQKIHGLVLADEGMKFATQEIRFAIDQIVLDQVLAASESANAATTVGNFNCTVGATQEWLWRIHEFKRYVSKASANIFAKTLRAQGNVVVGGINVTSLIEQLPDFKPAAGVGTKPPAGPHVTGTLGNRLIICNPFWDADTYVELFRGDNYLFAGLIYAPYVPLYATDPVTLADLTTQRGFMSQAAVKRINDGMFCKGTISSY